MPRRRHIVFVTGTRAELGLMMRTLAVIQGHPALRLSVIATGMHLDPRAGPRLSALRAANITPAATIPWPRSDSPAATAHTTGIVVAKLAEAFEQLKADCVLVVGDRVEAFAAAAAAHISRIPLAHIHGGDRAEGQVDDSLRHAITKLAHLHFAASEDAKSRLLKLGESPGDVHLVGAPGVEAIAVQAEPRDTALAYFPHLCDTAVVLLHPTDPDQRVEEIRAKSLLAGTARAGITHHLLLLPNNDPGSEGIRQAWKRAGTDEKFTVLADLPRSRFLALLRDCRLIAGNSSAGIIEAASFGTPVLDVGPRQAGRLHGPNVTHCSYRQSDIERATKAILRQPRLSKSDNPYERRDTARRIANVLATSKITHPAPPKLIAY